MGKSKEVVLIAPELYGPMALDDLWRGLKMTSLWWDFSLHGVKQKFRRSTLGPFWLTLSLGIFVVTLSFLRSKLSEGGVGEVMPTVATGLIFWTLFRGILDQSTSAFMGAKGYIRNVPLPISVHFYRVVASNIIVWMHNMIIYFFVLAFFIRDISPSFLLFPLGLSLMVLNASFLGLIIGIISARFRDTPPIISSILQILFFLTPIFWSPENFKDRPAFVDWNPIYHLIELTRAPLLGNWPDAFSWIVVSALTLLGAAVAIPLYGRSYARIPYWL